jgi:hypothetical protein
LKTAGPFIYVCLLGLATATTLLSSPVASGQSAYTCDEGRPFTARNSERIVSQEADGSKLTQYLGGLTARDSAGRIYSDLRTIRIEPPPKKTPDTSETPSHFGHQTRPRVDSTAWITDCHNGRHITVFPDLKIVRISKNTDASSWRRKSGASLFEFLTSGSRPPNVIFEDLGFKEVEGVLAHGYRSTILGTQEDGEWNGKVRYVDETWVSDDLSKIVLQILTDVRGKIETRITLSDIKREEPDASLFEIPVGYKTTVANDDGPARGLTPD